MNYRVLQLTNTAVGAVAADTLMPLGAVTRRICCSGNSGTPTFAISTSGTDTITLNKTGYYRVSYVGSLVAGTAGAVSLALVANGTPIYTVSETATAVGDTVNISLEYMVRVLPNCASVLNAPLNIQIENTGVALTGGTSNILIEKTY